MFIPLDGPAAQRSVYTCRTGVVNGRLGHLAFPVNRKVIDIIAAIGVNKVDRTDHG
jgi:hypothetical protein